ncbi:tetratricopeptide repeat protein [bacterium]|nr:tetratricopeptide repeat protein [bacterium]
MRSRLFFFIGMLLLVLTGCSNEPNRTKRLEDLHKEEAVVLRDLNDTARIRSLALAYRKLADEDPADTANAELLFKSGLLYRNIPGEGLQAIAHFRLLRQRFPEHRLGPEALFNEAMSWEADVEQLQPAAQAYSEFLNHYPDHALIPVVREQLDLLQKDEDPLETIRRFEREAAEKAPGVEVSPK